MRGEACAYIHIFKIQGGFLSLSSAETLRVAKPLVQRRRMLSPISYIIDRSLTSARKRAVEDPDTASASDTKRAKLDLEIPPQNLYSNPSTATSSTVDAMDVQHNVGNDGQSEAESHRDVDTEDLLDNAMVVDPGFKEMPYTFLAPDDPTLQACMYVNVNLCISNGLKPMIPLICTIENNSIWPRPSRPPTFSSATQKASLPGLST